MKIAYNWLKKYISTDLSPEKISGILTDIGLEVEGTDPYPVNASDLNGVVVGEVLTCEKAENSDKLHLNTISVGKGQPLSVICGAPNVRKGLKVAVATVGTKLKSKTGEEFEIKKAKIRGHLSEGMLCSEVELGAGEDNSGILELPEEAKPGTPITEVLDIKKDVVFEIGLTPNRSDAMGHFGVARDLFAYLSSHNQSASLHTPEQLSQDRKESGIFSIKNEIPEQAPLYTVLKIDNVKCAESPSWLKFALHSIGLEPVNNIVDATNFVMHALGQPMHAFDASVFSEDTVVVRNARQDEKLLTLDDKERKLSDKDIIIANAKGEALCLAGVFGGKTSGVSESTDTILLESAYFDPVTVRKTAKSQMLNTDASFRFERGTDPDMVLPAMQMAADLIIELAGGSVTAFAEYEAEGFNKKKPVIFRFSKLDQISGIKIHREQVKSILKNLGIEVLNDIPNGLELQVPECRTDVNREIDVIEEVMRIYGFNKINADAKISFTPSPEADKSQYRLLNKIGNFLCASGYNEVANNSLCAVSPEDEETVTLLNPLSSELRNMRKSLLPGILQNISYNQKRKQNNLRFFETGNCYFKKDGGYTEKSSLCIVQNESAPYSDWLGKEEKSLFYSVKSITERILNLFGADYTQAVTETDGLVYTSGSENLAIVRNLSQAECKSADIEGKVAVAELNLDNLLECWKNTSLKLKEIPKFNTVSRDMAFVIDKDVRYEDMKQAAQKLQSEVLTAVRLFDVYEGEKIGQGKKSYAMNFEYLNTEKTMEDTEINALMQSVISLFEKQFNAQLRN